MRGFHITSHRPGLLLLCLAVWLTFVASACAPAVAVLRTAAPAGLARAPESVRVYMDEQSAPAGYQELGLIIANSHVFIPVNFSLDTQLALAVQTVHRGNARDTRIFRALLRKAARLGADAIIIKGFSRVDVNLTISAVAIRTRCVPRAPRVPLCPLGTVPTPGYAPALPPVPADP